MKTARAILALLVAAASAAFAPAPAAGADGWTFRGAPGGASAGFAADGTYSGLWFECTASGGARLSVSTGGRALQAGIEQTAVVDIDGIAFLQRMRAAGTPVGPALRRDLPAPEFRQVAEALAKGRRAEVSMPAGRFLLPLKGSGKALTSLLAACR